MKTIEYRLMKHYKRFKTYMDNKTAEKYNKILKNCKLTKVMMSQQKLFETRIYILNN